MSSKRFQDRINAVQNMARSLPQSHRTHEIYNAMVEAGQHLDRTDAQLTSMICRRLFGTMETGKTLRDVEVALCWNERTPAEKETAR